MKNTNLAIILSGSIFTLFTANTPATETLSSQSEPAAGASINESLVPQSLRASQESVDTINQLMADNELDNMESALRKTAEENPYSVNAKVRLAGFLMSQNRTGESIPFFQEAITLTPDNPKLFASLSVAYLHQSEYSMAKAMADEALRLSPEMAQAKKLNEYIEAKQNVIELAEKASAKETIAPNDTLHNKVE